MDVPETADRSVPGVMDDETVADALDVLQDMVEWEIAAERWDLVCAVLDRMLAAYQSGDLPAFRRATAELELSGPVRATLIGTVPFEPIPDRARDRKNTLVHYLVAADRSWRSLPTTSERTPDRQAVDRPEGGDAEQRPF